jgi:hypothetical protein
MTSTPAPRSAAARTRAIKAALAAAGLGGLRVQTVPHHATVEVHGITDQTAAQVIAVLLDLGWTDAQPVERRPGSWHYITWAAA